LKENVQKLEYGLETVNKLNPVSYTWKSSMNKDTRMGFIAQEMDLVIPQIVVRPIVHLEDKKSSINKINSNTNMDNNYGIRYNELIPVLTKAIQELSE